MQKLFNFPPAAEPGGLTALSGTQAVIEVVGGILLALGFLTRPVALAHAPRNFFPVLNEGDSAILYCFIFLYFFFTGGGAWSVDAARRGTGLATP